MSLTDEQLDRYARHIVLRDVGGAGQGALLNAHVLLIGAGGIGCPASQYLAAAGVGTLTLVDDDVVSLSNLQRQTLYGADDIGRAKIDVAADRLFALNPGTKINKVPARVGPQHDASLFEGVDVVIDGSDNFATRLIVNDLCVAAKVPMVSAAIGQFQGQIGTFFGYLPNAPCYRCFVGDAHDPDDCDDCATQGVLGAMCGVMGSFAAMEAIRVITGFGDASVGKLHLFDGLTPSMRNIRLSKDPECKSCNNIPA